MEYGVGFVLTRARPLAAQVSGDSAGDECPLGRSHRVAFEDTTHRDDLCRLDGELSESFVDECEKFLIVHDVYVGDEVACSACRCCEADTGIGAKLLAG